MGSALMVAYHYPPEGSSSGVLRTLKYTKYLPRHGWTPHVLTLRESLYGVRDEGLLRDVPPEARVHRTRAIDSARHLAIRGRHLGALSVPDRFVGWVPFGVARGLSVVRGHAIDALYSTSPVPSAHLIAGVLKAATGLPWIADFRDPWIEEGLYPEPGSIRYSVESRLERAVMRRADRIVATTPYLRGDFLARYADLSPDRVTVIYNGYDEADFVTMEAPRKGDRFEIVHAGLVTPDYRDPGPLFEAIAALLAEGRLSRPRIRLTFWGGGEYLSSARFADTVRRLGLADVVEVKGRVPNREALRELRRADCLLLLQASDDTRSLIPAKAFEYLRVERPILALTLEGATSDLLKGMDACVVVNPCDTTALRGALATMHDRWQSSGDAVVAMRSIASFEREALTGQLAAILDDVTGRRRDQRS